eukprot:scaffold1624_cov105-Cylindrotheca_fusiformis.AAC.1
MRVKEIKDELEQLNVDYTDCFDKESLVSRLMDARNGKVQPKEEAKEEKSDTSTTNKEKQATTSSSSSSTASPKQQQQQNDEEFNVEKELKEIRGMRVRELREELGRRRIPRAGLFEKEDLVQAVLKAREASQGFSSTGLITPGQVADLTGEQVEEEMKHTGGGAVPLLLDVYATWCGPCQMMAPQLVQAAEEFGTTVRVAKMDSDKHPQMAGRLKVGGLPTLVLFHNGEEVDRIEGALMKDQLIQWDSSLERSCMGST